MRIGKLKKQILKVLYEEEKKPKDKSNWKTMGLRPKVIVERITKLKYPDEKKDFGITPRMKWGRLMIYAQTYEKIKSEKERKKVLDADPMTKKIEELNKRRDGFHKKSTSIYRALQLLKKDWLIAQVYSFYKGKRIKHGYLRYGLTETGSRIISHRL